MFCSIDAYICLSDKKFKAKVESNGWRNDTIYYIKYNKTYMYVLLTICYSLTYTSTIIHNTMSVNGHTSRQHDDLVSDFIKICQY